MQPGAVLASLGRAVSPTSRRLLARCGKPLAVLAVLAIGAAFFSSAAALIGTRQPTVAFHAAAEGVRGDPAHDLHALPLHQPSAAWAIALDDTLASLKAGAFGVTFAQPVLEVMAVSPDAAVAAGALVPSVLVDAEWPPLRIEIMGFDTVAPRAPASARRPEPQTLEDETLEAETLEVGPPQPETRR